jgi:hypothetical protein
MWGERVIAAPRRNPAPQGPGAGVSQAQPQAFSSSPGAQGQAPIRAVFVGRHRLLPTQETALKELNIDIVKTVENLPNDIQQLRQLLRDLRAQADAIVTVALPINLLIEIKKCRLQGVCI